MAIGRKGQPETVAEMTARVAEYGEILTVAEAAAVARRSVRTIRRAYRTGKLLAFRDGNGRSVRIRSEDLREWMMDAPAAAFIPEPFASPPPVGAVRHRKHTKSHPGQSENLKLLRAVQQRRARTRLG